VTTAGDICNHVETIVPRSETEHGVFESHYDHDLQNMKKCARLDYIRKLPMGSVISFVKKEREKRLHGKTKVTTTMFTKQTSRKFSVKEVIS
jgi:hypothetical protein